MKEKKNKKCTSLDVGAIVCVPSFLPFEMDKEWKIVYSAWGGNSLGMEYPMPDNVIPVDLVITPKAVNENEVKKILDAVRTTPRPCPARIYMADNKVVWDTVEMKVALYNCRLVNNALATIGYKEKKDYEFRFSSEVHEAIYKKPVVFTRYISGTPQEGAQEMKKG